MNYITYSQRLHSLKASLGVAIRSKFEDLNQPEPLAEQFSDLIQVTTPDRSASGSIGFYETPKLEWIVDAQIYANKLKFASSRLSAWCDASILVPHLVIEVLTNGSTGIVYFDYLARVDLAVEPEYLEKYYAALPNRLANLQREGCKAYSGGNTYSRGLASPAALFLTFELNEFTVSALEVVMSDYVNRWCTWVEEAPQTPAAIQYAIQKRDRAMRKNEAYLSMRNDAVDSLFDQKLIRRMVEGLAGPQS